MCLQLAEQRSMEKQDLALFNSIAQALFTAEKEEPVLKPIPSEKMYEQLNLVLGAEGSSHFEEELKALVLSAPRVNTKGFFNQLFWGRNSKASLGELLAVLLNNSMYTYKAAGPMIGLEKVMVKEMCKLLGYPETAGGTIATGGSMANFMAMVMARDKHHPRARYDGVGQDMVLYTSQESHYSIAKNAALMGVGKHRVRKVASDDKGKMRVSELERMIAEDYKAGFQPFFVNVTAGTTVLGAYDPINEIADISEKHGLWLHVDGAYGGSAMFSESYKHLLKGVERTDSFSICAHKMMGTPITCSFILTPHKKCLLDSFSQEASYLYQTDNTDELNLGKISFQCGRRNDALKFWTMWKALGSKGLEAIVDHQFDLAAYALDYVQQHPDYAVYSFEDSVNICFNYKGIPADKLCNQMYEEGIMMVGYGSFRETQFVRQVTVNALNSKEDMLHFFKQLEAFGDKMS